MGQRPSATKWQSIGADSEQAVNERIDAKIDKDIKALGQIKTMKAMGIGQPPFEPALGRLALA
jgi:hypothetical protein